MQMCCNKKGNFVYRQVLVVNISFFRRFCDQLVRPEDSEIFAYVASIINLEDTLVANITESDQLKPDEMDINWSHETKIRNASEKNVEVRASTSMDSIRSYEEIKAERHFLSPLNLRHINNMPFTRLMRLGTNVCCHFQEELG